MASTEASKRLEVAGPPPFWILLSSPPRAEPLAISSTSGAAIRQLQLYEATLDLYQRPGQVVSVLGPHSCRLATAHGQPFRMAFVQGRDTYTGQDVAFLVRDGIDFEQERFTYTHTGNADYTDLSKHLHVRLRYAGDEASLVVVHLITRLDARRRQARTLREWTCRRRWFSTKGA